MFNFSDVEEAKKVLKNIDKEIKKVSKGQKRNYFVSDKYIEKNNILNYLLMESKYVKEKMNEEVENCFNFLNNEEEAKKAGWYAKKQNPVVLEKWSEKAYPKRNVELFELEYDKEQIIKYLKNNK